MTLRPALTTRAAVFPKPCSGTGAAPRPMARSTGREEAPAALPRSQARVRPLHPDPCAARSEQRSDDRVSPTSVLQQARPSSVGVARLRVSPSAQTAFVFADRPACAARRGGWPRERMRWSRTLHDGAASMQCAMSRVAPAPVEPRCASASSSPAKQWMPTRQARGSPADRGTERSRARPVTYSPPIRRPRSPARRPAARC